MRPKNKKKEVKPEESNDKEEKDDDASSGSDDEIKELKAKQSTDMQTKILHMLHANEEIYDASSLYD